MKKFNTFIMILIITCVFGQVNIDELERVDDLWTKKGEKTPYTGEFVETFGNGNIKGRGTLKDGLLEGHRLQYYSNGQIKTDKHYRYAYTHGYSKQYYENGNMEEEGKYVKNQYDGIWTMYYPTGEKKTVLTMDMGVQNGPYYEYNREGELIKQYYFKDGKAQYSDKFVKCFNKGLEFAGQFKSEEAIELYNRAIEINPTIAEVYFNRGVCKGNKFDFVEAIEDYNKAIEIKPDYMEAYSNRGSAKINHLRNSGDAEPTYKETQSACEDLHMAQKLGDKTTTTSDLIYLHCAKKE
jgi:tetratricopeptide (TPR) repeat protein